MWLVTTHCIGVLRSVWSISRADDWPGRPSRPVECLLLFALTPECGGVVVCAGHLMGGVLGSDYVCASVCPAGSAGVGT